jgi:uncharacterized Zn-binding protein involved in type VI secretion
MGMPAARVDDTHNCPLVDPGPVPHVGGPILPPCCPTVLIYGMPAARVSDMAECVPGQDRIATGSPTVFIYGLPAARQDDTTEHRGVITSGCSKVLVG